jgi:Ca-activated chloride channel family protein
MNGRSLLALALSIGVSGWMVGLAHAEPPARTAPSTDAPIGSAADRRAAIAEATAAMQAEDWSAAEEAWGRLESLDPGLADAAYNRGVARYRAGDFNGAAEAFQRAARLGDADLAAHAMYNEGTARYAEALKALDAGASQAPPADGEGTDPLQESIERVAKSLDHFRDAIDADPASLDARANAELAHRLLRRLQQVQQQQQQQSGEGQQEEQDEQQDGEQSGEQQQSQDGQQSGEQQQPQDGQQSGEQQQPQDGQQSGEQQQPQDGEESGEQQQPQPGEEPQEQEQEQEQESPSAGAGSEPETDADATGAAESGEPTERMSREAAERLLQSVRDKERQRRREKAREASQGPRTPVERDW